MKKSSLSKKSFSSPDEVRKFDKGKADILNIAGIAIGRVVLEPGWKWSECVKPIVGGDSCQTTHTAYVISGKMEVVMEDGTRNQYAAGDVMFVPPGHDARTLGNETCILVDFTGMENYAKPQ